MSHSFISCPAVKHNSNLLWNLSRSKPAVSYRGAEVGARLLHTSARHRHGDVWVCFRHHALCGLQQRSVLTRAFSNFQNLQKGTSNPDSRIESDYIYSELYKMFCFLIQYNKIDAKKITRVLRAYIIIYS